MKKITNKSLESYFKDYHVILPVPEDIDHDIVNMIYQYTEGQEQHVIKKPAKRTYAVKFMYVTVAVLTVLCIILFRLSRDRIYNNVLPAQVSAVQGEAIVGRQGSLINLKEGSIINEHDMIITGKDSYCRLTINNDHSIGIFGDTSCYVKTLLLTYEKHDVDIYLKRGLLYLRINKLLQKSHFKVETSSLQAVVKGTEFFIEALPSHERELVAVYSGKVAVKPKHGTGTKEVIQTSEMYVVDPNRTGKESLGEREKELFEKGLLNNNQNNGYKQYRKEHTVPHPDKRINPVKHTHQKATDIKNTDNGHIPYIKKVTINSRHRWQVYTFDRPVTKIVNITGSWTVLLHHYRRVGPEGYNKNDFDLSTSRNFSKKHPAGALLLLLHEKIYWAKSTIELPHPTREIALRINDSDTELLDNMGVLEVTFSN